MVARNTVFGALIVWGLCLAPVRAGEIHDAARAADLARVKALLADDPQLVSASDGKGRTPLHLAAYLGHKDVVELLLAEGAPRDAKDRHGKTPMDAAAARGRNDIVLLLVEEQTVRLAEHIHRITLSFGLRSNTGVSAGPDGVLVVDTGEPPVAERLKSVVLALGKGQPKYIINTHPHYDHVGGNDVLGFQATIIDFGNLKQRASEGVLIPGKVSLKGKSGRVFDTYYSIRFNGEEIRLIPAPGAHTDFDLLVHFTDSGVVQMGDLLLTQSFPAVRGNVKRYLEILDTVIDVFPPETKFLAGHGRDYSMDEVKQYRAMLLETIEVVRKEMKAGKSVEQMQRENVLEKWQSWGEFLRFLDADYWITAVHDSYAK